MHNYVVLDLETLHSADACRMCGFPRADWATLGPVPSCVDRGGHQVIGWEDHAALGLSVGCYWDAVDQQIHWFDGATLAQTMTQLIEQQPLLVTFNGYQFDLPLMATLARNELSVSHLQAWQRLAAQSYDILREIWLVDLVNKFAKGLNSLAALAEANDLGRKTGMGAQAPQDWAAGRWASVLNYCQQDVYLTKALFDLVCAGEGIKRSNGSVLLPKPVCERSEEQVSITPLGR